MVSLIEYLNSFYAGLKGQLVIFLLITISYRYEVGNLSDLPVDKATIRYEVGRM